MSVSIFIVVITIFVEKNEIQYSILIGIHKNVQKNILRQNIKTKVQVTI